MIYFVTANRELFNNDIYKIIGVEESLSLLSNLSEISADTETEGLDEYTKNLISVQLGNKDFQVVVDCKTIDITLYKELFESSRVFIFWNALFDLRFFYKKGIYIRNVWDGYLAEKLLWLGYPPGVHSMSLKAAGENYLGIELDKSIRGKIIYQGLNSETIYYGANDVKYLGEIKNRQLDELKNKGLLKAIDIENRFVLVLAYCQHCGVKLDVEKWKSKMDKDKEREFVAIKKLNDWLIKNEPNSKYIFINRQGDFFTGFNLEPQVSINWNSAKQVTALFKKYNVIISVDDKNGGVKDSIDAKVLKPQKDKCSLIPLYLEYKEAVKVTSTYGENFLKQINPVSYRIHTNYNQLGADTTRITSGGKDKSSKVEYVNLLNLPADAETRACFIAEKGNKWISIDYSG